MKPERELKVAIFEDQQILRDSLQLLISGTAGYTVVCHQANGKNAAKLCQQYAPDVVLMDIDMPQVNGLEALEDIRSACPDCKVIMLTIYDDQDQLLQALSLGAHGYLLKSTPPSQLLDAIQQVVDGGAPLSPGIARKILNFFSKYPTPEPERVTLTQREKDVLFKLAEGYSYKMIAAALEVSIDTIRSHIRKIYRKLQVHSVAEAIHKAMEHGLL